MQTAGSLLKDEREQKNITIDEASAATKINPEYLKAIEEDDFKKFPSSVYAKGFVQNYAKYLGVSIDRVLALYRRSIGENPEPEVKTSKNPEKQPKFVLTPTVVVISIISTIVIVTLSYLGYQFYNFQKPPALEITNPQGNSTVEEPEIAVEGSTEPGMFVTINDEPVKVSQSGNFSTTIALSRGSNTIIIRSRHPDSIGKEAQVTLTIEYKPPDEEADSTGEEEKSEEPEEIAEPETMDLLITVGPENAWLEIEIDGESVFSSVATPGTGYSYSAEKNLYVRTGKTTSTTVKINDEAIELFPEAGGVASVICSLEDGTVDCRQP